MLLEEGEISRYSADFNKKHLYKAFLKKQTMFKPEMPKTTDS